MPVQRPMSLINKLRVPIAGLHFVGIVFIGAVLGLLVPPLGDHTGQLSSHGSLLLMEAGMQREWKHQVPKTKKLCEPRINLTFRWMVFLRERHQYLGSDPLRPTASGSDGSDQRAATGIFDENQCYPELV